MRNHSLQQAISNLAALFEFGALKASTAPAEFMDDARKEILCLRAELAALRAERDALRAAGKDALHALTSSRVFVTSRERCHHPDGTAWYDERVERLRAALGER